VSALSIRVQLAEAWDSIELDFPADESVGAVKLRALDALDPSAEAPDAYAVSHRGVCILDEAESLANAGVVNNGTLLIARRRRRPVR
jgi:hypothetical protein